MQGFNMGRYVPPELEGIQSFNQASGKKPTNRKPDGSQVVRFECPFAIWCTNCDPETIIGQGVRFNAEKRKVGSYYSTPIWAFRLKHTVCGGWIEVQTDPKNTEYVVVSGGRRRDTGTASRGEWLDGDGEAHVPLGGKALAEKEGAFAQLEKTKNDEDVANKEKARIDELKKRSERDWADPYEMNKRIRNDFRVGRRQRQHDAKTGEALQERFGLGLDLVAPDAEDADRAKLVDFRPEEKAGAYTTGIFEQQRLSSMPNAKDRGNRGRVNELATQRNALQSALKGNTRLKSDPFLNESEPWRPPLRRRPHQESATRGEEEGRTEPPVMAAAASSLVAYDSD